ncbi:MAG: hypothetical protein M0R17_05480 [Candidatus Omnitrophica bacterium]|jgi:hypothetical protein|nr:hypothetical protein [Candidatus Omnitrophota bacterium]
MNETDFRFVVVENKQNEPNRLQLEYSSNPPKLKSVGHINTLYEMHELMSRSLEILAPFKDDCQPYETQNTHTTSGFNINNVIKNYGIYFAPDFPDFLVPKMTPKEFKAAPQMVRNAITWGVVRQEPGTISQDDPFRGVRELKARNREFITYYNAFGRMKNTNITTYNDKFAYINIKAQVFDNLVQYNIWSKSNYEVERLTEWFIDDYMDNYIGMFREAGIVQMYYDRRVRDNVIEQTKNGYHLRSVLYYIRTERIKPEIVGPIKQITLNVSVESLQNLLKIEEGNSIGSTNDILLSKWIQRNQLGG